MNYGSVETLQTKVVDDLSVLSSVQSGLASEEGLKEVWNKTKERVALMFGSHVAMVKFVKENQDKFDQLNKEKMVRTVMGEDLQDSCIALEQLNKILEETRKGKPVDFDRFANDDLTKCGVELKEDGQLYADKFQCGNWGAGKGKANLKKPMTFKKTIKEFGWHRLAPVIADLFIKYTSAFDKSKMTTSIDNHYKDLMRVAGGTQEKTDLKTDKRVALNQIRNVLVIRNLFVKFIFGQLKAILGAVDVQQEAETTVDNNDSF